MQNSLFIFSLFIIVKLLNHLCKAYPSPPPIFNGYRIMDLYNGNSGRYTFDASAWDFYTPNTPSSKTSMCANALFVGGYGILAGGYIQRVYSGLPKHTVIYYLLKLAIIADWQSYDTLVVQIDGRNVSALNVTQMKPYFTSSSFSCGGASVVGIPTYAILGRLVHSQNPLTLRIISNLNRSSTVASYGVTNTYISVYNDTDTSSEWSCVRNGNNPFSPIFTGACRCATGYYYDTSLLTCVQCNSVCIECYGSSASQCIVCIATWSLVGTTCVHCNGACTGCSGPNFDNCLTCATPTAWLQWDTNSCASTCTSPLYAQETYGNYKVCQAPCLASQYLLWDDSCVSNCSAPLVSSNVTSGSYCNKPCNTGDYFYPANNTCLSTCTSPFIQTTASGVSLCTWPCSASQYVLQNGSCNSTCTYPYVSYNTSNGLLCNKPCNSGSYFYSSNSSCLSTCASPFIQATTSGVSLCTWPCSASQYVLQNGSCNNTCTYPYVSYNTSNGLLCNKPCNSGSYFYSSNSSCLSTCSSPFVQTNKSNVSFCEWLCSTNQYLLWNGTCNTTCMSPFLSANMSGGLMCNKPCDTGKYFLPVNNTCSTICNSPFILANKSNISMCVWPCYTGHYLLWNGTCNTTCTSPLTTRTATEGLYCEKPCPSGSYFFPGNSSCKSSCNSPFAHNTTLNVDLCVWPCKNGYYLLPNGSCTPTCNTPYQKITAPEGKYCNLPCSTSQYILLNGSCSNTCSTPFLSTIQDSRQFCINPCLSTQTLYYNGSCISTCDFPHYSQPELDSNVCLHPCQNTSHYYYEDLLTCQPACNSTYLSKTNGDVKICSSSLSSGTVGTGTAGTGTASTGTAGTGTEETSKIIQVIVAERKITKIELMMLSATSFTQVMCISIAAVAKMLQYIRYMNVNYSPRLLQMFKQTQDTTLSINFGLPLAESIEERFTKYPLPTNFERYNLHSSFFINYWNTFSTILIVLAVIVISLIVLRFSRKTSKVHSFFSQVTLVTKWDYILMVICSNYDDIILFSSLEFRTIHINSFSNAMSFLACIAINIAAVFILCKTVYIIQDLRTKRKQMHDTHKTSESHTEHHARWKDYYILFEGFKTKDFVQQAFIFVYLLRVCLFHLIISYMINFPFIQAILITSLNVFTLLYLIIQRPFKEKYDLLHIVINESTLLVVNVCVVILCSLEALQIESISQNFFLCDIIIITNLVFNTLALGLIAAEIIHVLIKVVKTIREQKAKGVKSITMILEIFLKGDGMGGEEKEATAKVTPLKKKSLDEETNNNDEASKQSPLSYQLRSSQLGQSSTVLNVLDDDTLSLEENRRLTYKRSRRFNQVGHLLVERETATSLRSRFFPASRTFSSRQNSQFSSPMSLKKLTNDSLGEMGENKSASGYNEPNKVLSNMFTTIPLRQRTRNIMDRQSRIARTLVPKLDSLE